MRIQRNIYVCVVLLAFAGFVVRAQSTIPLGNCVSNCGNADTATYLYELQASGCNELGSGRCTYSVAPITLETFGQWTKDDEDVIVVENCQNGSCETSSHSYSVTSEEKAESHHEWDFGGTAKGTINVLFTAGTEITAETSYKQGGSDTSTIIEEQTHTLNIEAAECSKKIRYFQYWKQSRPAHTTLTAQLEWQFTHNGQPCNGWIPLPWENGTCTAPSQFLPASQKTEFKQETCPVTCTTLHQSCSKSCTTTPTGTCPTNTYP